MGTEILVVQSCHLHNNQHPQLLLGQPASVYSRTCLEIPPYWPLKSGLSRRVVFGDRFNYIEMWDLLPGISGLSRQVVFHGSGLSRKVLLYIYTVNLYKDHPRDKPNVVLAHRWFLYAGSIARKVYPWEPSNVVVINRWSLEQV